MQTARHILTFLFLFGVISFIGAQQTPFLNQYVWNPRLFNPAAQGFSGNGQITAAYRMQFQELDAADRPTTYLLHADLSAFVPKRIGAGIQVLRDQTHILNHMQFSGFFAYHLIQESNLRLSLGAAAGIRMQNFDFTNRRLADVIDLAIFSNEMSGTRFDGGPGLAFEYRTGNGSVIAFDAAATQLFSSNIPVTESGDEVAVYRTVPHILFNARYRYQGTGFALEPAVTFRALTGEQTRSTGLFDLNLNVHFLKNDLLTAGVGYRTDQGGVHFQIGVQPTPAIRLFAAAELHDKLGTGYELGAGYSFGRPVRTPKPNPATITPQPSKNLLANEYAEIQILAKSTDEGLDNARRSQELAEKSIAAGMTVRNDTQKAIASDSCILQLAEAENALRLARQNANAIQVKRLQAEQAVRTATTNGAQVSAETQATLQNIIERSAEVAGRQEALEANQKNLQERCSALRPKRNEVACIRNGDTNCVRESFASGLSQVKGLPANLSPLRCFVFPGAATVTYHYPDDAEAYVLSPDKAALANHIAERVRTLEQQGARLENITLVTELQEDKSTLAYQPGLQYNGDFSNTPIQYTLVDNDDAASSTQSLSPQAGTRISLEALGVLKMEALRTFLVQSGIPANRILLQVRYNHNTNIYREETKVVLKLRG